MWLCSWPKRRHTCSRGLWSGFCRDDPQEPSSRVASDSCCWGVGPTALLTPEAPSHGGRAGLRLARVSHLSGSRRWLSTRSWGPPWPRFSPLPFPALYSWSRLSFASSFHPRVSFSLPWNCYSQTSQTSPTTGLWSRLYPCSQDDSQQVERREAQTSLLGLPYLDRRRLLRWAKVCFRYFIRRIFVTKTLQSDFSREFLFLIFKLLFKFQYQIINRYNFSEHLQRGHLQDLAQRTMCYYKELCHFERYFRPVDQILAYFSWLNSTD